MSVLQVLTRALIALVVVAILGFAMFSFQVASNEGAVLTRFGSPVRTLQEPGLYFKWPWPIDTVNRFDARLAFHDTRLSEALAQDKHNIILPVFIAWRVADPLKFLQALGTPAAGRANSTVSPPARATPCSAATIFQELVTTDPAKLKLAEFEQRLGEAIRTPPPSPASASPLSRSASNESRCLKPTRSMFSNG